MKHRLVYFNKFPQRITKLVAYIFLLSLKTSCCRITHFHLSIQLLNMTYYFNNSGDSAMPLIAYLDCHWFSDWSTEIPLMYPLTV